ncbi:hypothetical protein [Ammoniphilus resinae]|uniref:Membrane protein n=1 Tax=Ammoniphilus resinae TaxID=861532 RepID=A0ABS4GRC4_9BACL|nr:hypothetical protein [Ammoniphilus resinae]MBP1932825.1 putative membrane protein [Ammoniphilus resinae]
MIREEKGSAAILLIFLAAVIWMTVLWLYPYLSASHQMTQNEWGKLQARMNAEAGLLLAVEKWKENPEIPREMIFELSDGSVKVQCTENGVDGLEFVSEGTSAPSYKDTIFASYDSIAEQWVHWHRGGN